MAKKKMVSEWRCDGSKAVKHTAIGIKAVTDFFLCDIYKEGRRFMCRGCPLQVKMRKDITNCVRLCPVPSDVRPRE